MHLMKLYVNQLEPLEREQRLEEERRRRPENDPTTIAWVASKKAPFRIRGHSDVYTERTPHRFTDKDMYRWFDQHVSKSSKKTYKLWGVPLLPTKGKPTKLQRSIEKGKKIAQRVLDDMEAYETLQGQGAAVPPYPEWVELRHRQDMAGRRGTAKATQANPKHDSTQRQRDQAKALEHWHALERAGIPARKRKPIIAQKMGVNPSTVSRYLAK
jgi:hypothetical protein